MEEPIVAAELAEGPVAATLASSKQPRVQISLATLLLWVFGTAVVLSTERSRVNVATLSGIVQFPAESGFIGTYALISRLIVSPLLGIAVVFSAQALWSRAVRGQRQTTEPGHWVLHQFAAWLLASALAAPIFDLLSPYAANLTDEEYASRQTLRLCAAAIPVLASGLISVCAFFQLAGPLRWRVVFGTHAAGALLLLVVVALHLILDGAVALQDAYPAASTLLLFCFLGQFVLFVINGIACLISLLAEFTRPRPLDRMHWIGVGMLLLYAILVIADSLATSVKPYVT